jgi:hypothetical protein
MKIVCLCDVSTTRKRSTRKAFYESRRRQWCSTANGFRDYQNLAALTIAKVAVTGINLSEIKDHDRKNAFGSRYSGAISRAITFLTRAFFVLLALAGTKIKPVDQCSPQSFTHRRFLRLLSALRICQSAF